MSGPKLAWTCFLLGRLACFVAAGHGGGYASAGSYGSAASYGSSGSYGSGSGSASASFSSSGCMTCLCQAATGCDVNKQCVGDVCGAFAISWQYWKDAGQPGGDYVSCANNPSCALNCVQTYVNKFIQDCDGNGVVDCEDAARLHRLGRTGCSGWLDNEFASRLSSCDASNAPAISSFFAQVKQTSPTQYSSPPSYQNQVGPVPSGCSTCSGSGYVGSTGSNGISYGGNSGQGYVGSSGPSLSNGIGYVSSSGTGYTGSNYVGSSGSSGGKSGSNGGYVGSSGSGYTGSSGSGYTGSSGTGYSSKSGSGYVGSNGVSLNSGGSRYTSGSTRYPAGSYPQSVGPVPTYQNPAYQVSSGGGHAAASASASASAQSASGWHGYSGGSPGSSGSGIAGVSGYNSGSGYGTSAGSYAGAGVSDNCLSCICNAATGCSLSAGCNHAGCGPLRISQAYWIDAGSPGGDYHGCTNNMECSMNCARTYLTKYAKDCDGDGAIQCGDYARIHRLGGYGCQGELDWQFKSQIQTCPA